MNKCINILYTKQRMNVIFIQCSFLSMNENQRMNKCINILNTKERENVFKYKWKSKDVLFSLWIRMEDEFLYEWE